MANNVLDLEPKKIQALSGGVQPPTIKVSNTDISQSVDDLANTIMSIGGSIIKNNREKEAEERKNLLKQEKENLDNYNEILLLQSTEMINAGYAGFRAKMGDFYSNPSVFDSILDGGFDNYYKSITDNKGLTEVTKAKLQVENKKGYRKVKEKFEIGLNEYNIQNNKDELDKKISESIDNISNYVYDGDIESAMKSLVVLTDGMKLGMKINPEEYTPENMRQTLGVVTSRWLESYVGGTIGRYKDKHDLNTTDGLNDFIEQLVAYGKNFDSKEMRNFFKEVFKGLPYEHKNIDAKVHSMIKRQVEQELWLANNKKKGIKERTLKQQQQDQINYHNVLQNQDSVYNGRESNFQRAYILGAKFDKEFDSGVEAGKYAEDNEEIYSLFSKNEKIILKNRIEPLLEINDSEGILEIFNEIYDFKILDKDGNIAFPYDVDMLYLDIAEVTGGLIDGNYYKAYREKNEEVINDYKTSLRFSDNNEYVGGKTGLSLEELGGLSLLGKPWRGSYDDTSFFASPYDVSVRILKGDVPMEVMNDKITYLYTNEDNIKVPERLRTLVSNFAFSYFYKSILRDEDKIKKFNSENDKGKKKMIEKFYDKKEKLEELDRASESFSENFLSGNIIHITSGDISSEILVSDEFKDLDFNGIKDDIIESGSLIYIDPDTNKAYRMSKSKLRSNLVIETFGEDGIGFFYKDRQHLLKFVKDGKFVDAEADLSVYTDTGTEIGRIRKESDIVTKDDQPTYTEEDSKLDSINQTHYSMFKEYGGVEEGKITEEEDVEIILDKSGKEKNKLSPKTLKIRNVKNNNPGNLKEVGIPYKGKLEETDSGGKVASGSFVKFETAQYGIRALGKDLDSKINRGLNTITKILNVYAPEGRENDTRAYIKAVSQATGIDSNKPLTKDDMFGLIKAIIAHEGGKESLDYYTDEIIREGMEMK